MGLGHFLSSVDKALTNVGRAGEFALTHPDKVIKGAGQVADYAVHHPGQVADIAKKELVHSLTDPKELLINAALIATTAGAGVVAKSAAEVGVKTGAEVGGKVLAKTAEETTAKVAGETAAKATAETAEKVGAETAGRTLEQKVLETGRHNPITRRVNEFRSGAAQNFLARGGENPSALRQAGAAAIQGSSGTAPKQLEGMSDLAHSVQRTAWRGQQINKRVGQVQGAGRGVEAAAHPYEAALEAGTKASSGDTPVSQPGTEIEPYRQPGNLQPLSQPANNTYTPGRGFSTPAAGGGGGSTPPPMQPPGSSAYGGMPGSSNNPSSASTSTTASQPQSAAYRAGRGFGQKIVGPASRTTTGKKAGSYLTKPAVQSTGGLRAWQGPHREMFGGIDPNYDWRKGYENRPDKPHKPKLRKLGDVAQETPGAYDTKSGQQPEGALNPGAPKMTTMGELGTGVKGELGSGPPVHFGAPGPFTMGQPQAITQGARKASFYAGSGEYTPQMPKNTSPGGNIIDADSMSPDDYKFEPGGQGYLDFPDMPRAPLTQPKRGKQVLGV